MKLSTLLFATLFLSPVSQASNDLPNKIKVSQSLARATLPVQRSGAAYLHLENLGKQKDHLIAVSSPVAKSVEIHTMSMEGDVMKMRAVEKLPLAAGSKLVMQPGAGYHLMLIDLKAPLKAGSKFPLVLQFEKAGQLEVEVKVEGSSGAAAHSDHAKH